MALGSSNKVVLTFAGQSKDLEQKFDRVGRSSDDFGRRLKMVGLAATAAAAAVGAAAIKFGIDAVKSFMEAEKAQAELQDAFARFPKLADTNIQALRKLNTQLARKTRFDDDATASGQAVLAQFKLTGAQIKTLTPLLQDYAAKTGKDLPAAADLLGRALLGKGRALAEIGIKFKDAGSVAANFDQIVAGLRTQVGGFAEKEGQTVAGKLEILKNRFGELKEAAGEKLLGVLIPLSDRLSAFADEAAPRIQGFVDTELAGLKSSLIDLKDNVLTGVKSGFDDIKRSVDENTDSWRKLAGAIDAFVKAAGPVAKFLTTLIGEATGAALAWFAALINAADKAIRWLKDVWEWLSRVSGLQNLTVSRKQLGGGGGGGGGGGVVSPADRPPRFHGGGTVPGAPGTEMLAVLQAGERVTPAGQPPKVVIELRSSGARMDDLLLELFSIAVGKRGGNFEAAVASFAGGRR